MSPRLLGEMTVLQKKKSPKYLMSVNHFASAEPFGIYMNVKQK